MASIRVALELVNRQFNRALDQSQREVSEFKKSISGVGQLIAGAFAVREVVNFANTAQNLQNRLRGISGTAAEAASAFDLVRQVAGTTRSDISAVGDLFSNLTVATAEMGKTQSEVARIAETFSKSLKISGADAGTAAGAIRQFGQALGSGVLRGDEFNSIMEANPVFMRQVAEQLGVTIGEMRGLAEQGLLTSGIMVQATTDIASAIDNDFGNTTATLSERFGELKNNIVVLFTEIENRYNVFENLGNIIKLVGDNLTYVGAALAYALGAKAATMVVGMVSAIINLTKALRGAATAAAILQGVTGIGLVKVLGGLTASGGALYMLNKMFGETNEELDNLSTGINSDLGTAPTAPDQTQTAAPSRAKLLLDDTIQLAKAQKQAKAENKKADTEALRALREQQAERERILEQIERNKQSLADLLATEKAGLQNSLDRINLETQLSGLSDREKTNRREIADLEAQRAESIAEIMALKLSVDEAENLALQGEELAEINALYDQMIEKITGAKTANQEQARSFATGWSEAFANFKDSVEDNAAYAGRLFDTMANGFSDSILTFVETGKLSFKDLFKSLMSEIIKMQANKLFLSLFDGGSGILGSLFAGFRADGGPVTANKPYIVGERGPELFMPSSSGNIVSNESLSGMGGSGGQTVVNYNINAVDSMSFKQMVARDPEFMYAITQRGARSLPR